MRVIEDVADYVVQFTLERKAGTYARIAISWIASALIDLTSDISPTQGTVCISAKLS